MKKFKGVAAMVTCSILLVAGLMFAQNQSKQSDETGVELVQGADVVMLDCNSEMAVSQPAITYASLEYSQPDIILASDEAEDDSGSGWDFQTILNAILGILSLVFGTLLSKSKGKIKQLLTVGKQLVEAGDAIDTALEDNQVNSTEVETIKTEWNDVKEAWKEFWDFSDE
jgi:hypothetical protein